MERRNHLPTSQVLWLILSIPFVSPGFFIRLWWHSVIIKDRERERELIKIQSHIKSLMKSLLSRDDDDNLKVSLDAEKFRDVQSHVIQINVLQLWWWETSSRIAFVLTFMNHSDDWVWQEVDSIDPVAHVEILKGKPFLHLLKLYND